MHAATEWPDVQSTKRTSGSHNAAQMWGAGALPQHIPKHATHQSSCPFRPRPERPQGTSGIAHEYGSATEVCRAGAAAVITTGCIGSHTPLSVKTALQRNGHDPARAAAAQRSAAPAVPPAHSAHHKQWKTERSKHEAGSTPQTPPRAAAGASV